MAGSATTELKVLVNTPGVEKLPQLSSSLKRLSGDTAKAGINTKKLANNLKEWEKNTVVSINRNRQLSVAWKELAASVQFGSNRFKEATAEAKRLDASLMKMQGTSKGAGGLGRMARTAGAVAGAGVFGGPEGALGAAIGGLMPGGGPISAAVGGAIGAQVGMVRQSISAIAEYDAALERQRKALRLVIADTNQYNDSQEFLSQTSKELAIPQDVIVRQFTQLAASVKGAGGNIEDAKDSFRAIASGIRGTGGNLEDMRAAMVATSQVFSKGKVSAEELRQQLGERLPGAFTLFAKSMGKTPAELDKALEGGKVTLQDFMKFTDTLTDEYFENAKKLALGPEAAGDRLKTAMSDFKDAIGDILTPIGAKFQEVFAAIVESITDAIKAFNRFMGIGLDNAIEKAKQDVANLREEVDRFDEDPKDNRSRLAKGRFVNKLSMAEEKLNKLLEKQKKISGESTSSLREDVEGLNKGLGETINLTEKVGQTIRSGIVDAIEGAITGAKSLGEVLSGVLRSIGRMYLQAAVNKIPLPGLNANGNVYGSNGIVPFAKGGVVSQPTIFPYAKGGIGLMGEAGPEAIMPLKRGSDGRLGVEAKYRGGGGTTVNYTGPTLNFNGDEYVPRSAIGEIIATATSQGAKAGENRTLSTLRNSRSTRSRLGM